MGVFIPVRIFGIFLFDKFFRPPVNHAKMQVFANDSTKYVYIQIYWFSLFASKIVPWLVKLFCTYCKGRFYLKHVMQMIWKSTNTWLKLEKIIGDIIRGEIAITM